MHLGLGSSLQERRHHLPAEHHAGPHVREQDVPEAHRVVVAQQLEHFLHVRHRGELLETHPCGWRAREAWARWPEEIWATAVRGAWTIYPNRISISATLNALSGRNRLGGMEDISNIGALLPH